MSDPSSKQIEKNGVDENGNGNGNERSVTDPVTHQPVQIHDVSKVELEQLPPPPTEKHETEAVKADDGHSSYERHQHMDQLVHEVTEGNWWEDPLGDQRRTRVQTSLVAGASAGAGLLGVVMLYWTFNDWFGRTGSWGVIDVICVVIGCVLLGIGVTAASVSFRLVQEDAKTVPDFQDNKVRILPIRSVQYTNHSTAQGYPQPLRTQRQLGQARNCRLAQFSAQVSLAYRKSLPFRRHRRHA